MQAKTQPNGSIRAIIKLEDGRELPSVEIPIEFVGQLVVLLQAAILQVKANDLLEEKAKHET